MREIPKLIVLTGESGLLGLCIVLNSSRTSINLLEQKFWFQIVLNWFNKYVETKKTRC